MGHSILGIHVCIYTPACLLLQRLTTIDVLVLALGFHRTASCRSRILPSTRGNRTSRTKCLYRILLGPWNGSSNKGTRVSMPLLVVHIAYWSCCRRRQHSMVHFLRQREDDRTMGILFELCCPSVFCCTGTGCAPNCLIHLSEL